MVKTVLNTVSRNVGFSPPWMLLTVCFVSLMHDACCVWMGFNNVGGVMVSEKAESNVVLHRQHCETLHESKKTSHSRQLYGKSCKPTNRQNRIS